MWRILIVDDETAVLQLLKSYLTRMGHEVTCCATGSAGLAALDQPDNHFDVAVLDHWLPDMDGMDVLVGALARRENLKVLVSSGSFIDIENLRIPQAQRVAFLAKPYLPKMLGEAIEKLLEGEARPTA